MRSIVWRLAPLVAVLGVFFDQTNAADPGLYNVRQLTQKGKHSFPQLSADGRYVYFSAQGSGYGSKTCDDIYKLDLKYWNETRANWKISRVSPGFGHSSHVDAPLTNTDGTIFYESTFHNLYAHQTSDPAAGTNNWWCPTKPCDTAGIAACGVSARVEFYDGTTIYSSDAYGQVSVQKFAPPTSAGSYFSCPRRGRGSLVHIRPLSTAVGTTNTVEGAYPYIDNNIFVAAADAGGALGYFDGVNYGTTTDATPQYVAYFHGVPDAAGHTTGDASFSPNVFDPRNNAIYKTFVDANGKRLTGAAASPATAFYTSGGTTGLDLALYPQSYKSGTNVIFSGRTTGTSPTEIIYNALPQPAGAPALIQLSDPSLNSKQASLARSGDKLVFVRQPSAGSDYQVFIGDLGNGQVQPTYTALPWTDLGSKESDYIYLLKAVQLPGRIGQVRAAERTGDLIFEYNVHPDNNPQCKQVYHVDTTLDDFSNPRLLSSGLGTVDGLSFYEDISSTTISTSVIYASDFIKNAPSDQNAAHNCAKDVCDPTTSPDQTLSDFCKNNQNGDQKTYKYLGPDFEIYQSDIFGSFVKRHTQNSMYDGQPAVSPDNTQLVFTRSTGDRVDLILRQSLTDASPKDILLTDRLATGYFDHASWSPDGKYIAFHGYEVDDANVLDFRRMLGYNVVSTKQTDIYVIRLSDLQPTKISYGVPMAKSSSFANPAFSTYNTIVYDGTIDGVTQQFEYDFVTGTQKMIYDGKTVGVSKPAFIPKNPNYITFTSDVSDGKTPATYTDYIVLAQYTSTNGPTSSSTSTPYVPTTSVSKLASDGSTTTGKPGSTTKGIGAVTPTAFGLLVTSLLLAFGRQ